jgi:hypothetical protein
MCKLLRDVSLCLHTPVLDTLKSVAVVTRLVSIARVVGDGVTTETPVVILNVVVIGYIESDFDNAFATREHSNSR